MSKFMGGSAYSFARDIAGGYTIVTARTFRGMSPGEMNQLSHEMDRLLRELRGEVTVNQEQAVVRARQLKIQRLNGALAVLRASRSARR